MSRNKSIFIAALLAAYAIFTLILTLFLTEVRPVATSLGQLKGKTYLPDMRSISEIPQRKKQFIGTLAPIIQQKNDQLRQLRQSLKLWLAQLNEGNSLTHRQALLLKRLEARYKLSDNTQQPSLERITALLKRVDTLPASLVLAQAAKESGWGTSRFAREANNLFGQWCYQKGCGLVPKRRSSGARHEVQTFAAIEPAIDAYFHNLNTHQAYAELRRERQRLRQAGETATGTQLAGYLKHYSSRGQVYIEELKALISYNKLAQYDLIAPITAQE
ncbi:glucosaminidase domain-containing protein [Gilvimarinus agarilyticus]|uniref:glucosaminidase domain-containing protein n=1 Tax=Gilvimarinus sp. 2_MG-2023 TaxID=3062666 RepID=UPI001C0A2833|nr:glucosaminidase domain-containing protein [Gilvimarinus sp. 2_MG-2023]MBU2886641.1 glucosaminidase domain-containing protein [Gilvimarinus agarilyticus]MDO6571309.1 glucosaminidase domain-containing protein [Gilvimarinus sp. 2_MG-2023]